MVIVLLIATVALGVAVVVVVAICIDRTRARSLEKHYSTVLDNLPATSVVLFDRELRILLASGPMEASPPGTTVAEGLPGEQAEMLMRHYRAALAGETSSLEYQAEDGREQWLRLVPVRERGEVVGGLAVSQDITERKRVERQGKLAESGRQLMIDAMNEAYVAVDSDGLIIDWNERATQTFGYSRDEAIGQPAKELIVPAIDHADFDRVRKAFTRGERRHDRLELRSEQTALRKDGRLLPVELAAASLSVDGEVSLHTFMHDISDRKRDEAELEAHAADVEALAEVTAVLARSNESAEARVAICRAAQKIARCDFVLLFEPDPARRELVVVSAVGTDVDGTRLPFVGGQSGAVRAFTTQEQLFVGDLENDPSVAQFLVRQTGARSALWVPVCQGQTALGVVATAWRQPHDQVPARVSRMMELVAADAAVAVQRAGTFAELDHLARTDDLTGLPNRRAWDEALKREMRRAQAEGSSLAVAMVDLDNFKAYNDRFGHLAGDRLLEDAAAAWRGVLRDADLLARYGGEEFSIVLPNCHAVAAVALVERLRGMTPSGETCSAGISVWDGAETAQALVGRADQALYAAKQAGRNRTVSA